MSGRSEWDGHPDDAIDPCGHMRGLLSALCDGRLRGLFLWYARRHTASCPHCAAAFASLLVLQARLRRRVTAAEAATNSANMSLQSERWATLEAEWARIDDHS